jgi:uncharacterized peroxidase-related enzyme
MLRLNPVEPNQVGEELQGILERNHLGFDETQGFVKILAKSPAAARAYVLAEGALAEGRLSDRQREQIALAVAEINGSQYCLLAHSLAGRHAGLSGEEIESARRAAASDAKADRMLRFTQSMVLQRGEISDEDLGALRKAGFSDAEVIEIVANIALNIFTNYLNILSKTEVEFPAIADGQANALPSKAISTPA